jgi:Zn-dependent protease
MIITTIFILLVLFFSIIIHEIAHGSVALLLGDNTAKNEGRLTLNPLKHIDFFGTIILPFFLLLATRGAGPVFGLAKPVPINPYNFKDKKWGSLKVAVAGPAINFIIAMFFGLLVRFINMPQNFSELISVIVFYNFLWGFFNLLPIPPLDGSHILFTLLPESWINFKNFMHQYGIVILIFLIFFGLDFLANGAYYFSYLTGGDKIVYLLNNFFTGS